MFGNHWLSQIPQDRHDDFFQQVEDAARSTLLRESVWYADYRRLRVVAKKNDAFSRS